MARRTGVLVCGCGPNIADAVDIDAIIKEVSSIDGVVYADTFKLLCSPDGKKFVSEKIREHDLNHLVVAACSPKQHEGTFMEACVQAGLNPFLLQMANIREQCAWITPDKEKATHKAMRMTTAAIERVHFHEPLEKKEIECGSDVLIIGGGVAGVQAALMLASSDRTVYLVEKSGTIGGRVTGFGAVFPSMESGAELVKEGIEAALASENIRVLTETEVEQVLGFFGNFVVRIRGKGVKEVGEEFKIGGVVVATGAEPLDPGQWPQYGYGRIDNVCTALEFEGMNASGRISLKDGQAPRSVAVIHCVGRKQAGYCSRICCLYSLKFTRYLKEKVPGVKVTHFVSGLCLPGKSYQSFFEETRGEGVDFIRSTEVKFAQEHKSIAISYEDERGRQSSLAVDMAIISPALGAAAGAEQIAETLNVSQGMGGFFSEQHEKLGPISTMIEGVYIAGCAHGPGSIPDARVQAEAAAGKILSSLIPGKKLEVEAKTSTIPASLCTGCKTCLTVCSYRAISFDEIRGVSVVNEVLCQGCGNCAAACPSGAARPRHFTAKQLQREIAEITR